MGPCHKAAIICSRRWKVQTPIPRQSTPKLTSSLSAVFAIRVYDYHEFSNYGVQRTGCRTPVSAGIGPENELDMRYYQSYTIVMKTAISIPDKVFRSADSLAKRLGISRSQLYSTAIAEYLSKHQGKQVTDRLNAIYSEEDSSLSPSLMIMQAKSLAHEEW